MQDFLELCRRRESCRNFSEKPVEREKLERCVEAARLTQSGCNSQPWSFVVVDTPEMVREVAKCGQQMGINAFLEKAQAFIIVLEEHAALMPMIRSVLDSQYFAKGDLGAAAHTVCLAAAEQGLGTCMIGLYNRERLCELLDIPAEKQFAAYIAVGYPATDKPREKTRKPLAEIVRYA